MFLGIGVPAYAQNGTAASGQDSTLVPDPDVYIQQLLALVDELVLHAADPEIPRLRERGREAASQGDWDTTISVVDAIAARDAPPELVGLLHSLIAAGQRNWPKHRATLAETAPILVSAGHTQLAVETWRYLARLETDNGDPNLAREYLGHALALDPANAGVHYGLGRVRWVVDDKSGAVEAWERAVQLAPEDALGWLTLAEGYAAIEKTRLAFASMERAIALAPTWAAPRRQMARWLLADGRPALAFDVLIPVAPLAREDRQLRDLMRNVVERMGRSAAFDQARHRVEQAGNGAPAWAEMGQWYAAAGSLEDSEIAYTNAIALDPVNAEYLFLLGGVRTRMFDVAGAITAYKQAIAQGFSGPGAHYQLAMLYGMAEQYENADAAFAAALAKGGLEPFVVPQRAKIMLRDGRVEEAAALIERLLDQGIASADTWRLLGRAQMRLALPGEAFNSFERSRNLDSGHPETPFLQGQAAFALGDYSTALAAFENAWARGWDGPATVYWSARAAQLQGRYGLAFQRYEWALGRAHQFGEAWQGVAELEQGRGRLAEATRTYQRAEAIGLVSAHVHYGLGEIALAEGNLGEARTQLERTVELDPELGDAWRKLGAAYVGVGENRLARRAFARAYDSQWQGWFVARQLDRFFRGVIWIGAFLVVLIVGSRLRRSPSDTWLQEFRARLDLGALLILALLAPIALMILGQRLIVSSFELQRLTNQTALGLNTLVGVRDSVFLAIVPFLYLWKRHGRPRFDLLHSGNIPRQAIIGVVGFGIMIIPILISTYLQRDTLFGDWQLRAGSDFFNATPRTMLASIIGIGFVSSISQEIFYRGIVFPLARAQVGVWVAAILSAVLFAAFHFQPSGFLIYFAFGMVAVGLYQRTGSLIAPTVMHVMYNTLHVVT